jgi:hypothetical protein
MLRAAHREPPPEGDNAPLEIAEGPPVVSAERLALLLGGFAGRADYIVRAYVSPLDSFHDDEAERLGRRRHHPRHAVAVQLVELLDLGTDGLERSGDRPRPSGCG